MQAEVFGDLTVAVCLAGIGRDDRLVSLSVFCRDRRKGRRPSTEDSIRIGLAMHSSLAHLGTMLQGEN